MSHTAPAAQYGSLPSLTQKSNLLCSLPPIYTHRHHDIGYKTETNMGESHMALMPMFTLTAVDNGPMRLILFILVLVAVILIMVGCIIALLTWRKRQRVYSAYMHAAQWGRNKI